MKRHWALLLVIASIFVVMGTPLAAQSNLDDKIDSNINDWVASHRVLQTRSSEESFSARLIPPCTGRVKDRHHEALSSPRATFLNVTQDQRQRLTSFAEKWVVVRT